MGLASAMTCRCRWGFGCVGAGATIVLTFAVTALYLREFHTNWEHLHFNLLKISPIRWLAHPRVVAAIRALSVVAFLATIYAGLAGTDDPYENRRTFPRRLPLNSKFVPQARGWPSLD